MLSWPPSWSVRRICAVLTGLFLLAGAVSYHPALAQQGLADSFSGFSRDSDAPISIEADSLEVRDNDQVAVFRGNVVVRQDDVTLRTRTLRVYYRGSAQNSDGQDIDRLEADGGVVVTAQDQKATGDRAVFESARDLITLSGNVVLSQGDNVLTGDRLLVDLARGTSQVFASGGGSGTPGRVQGLFRPGTVRE